MQEYSKQEGAKGRPVGVSIIAVLMWISSVATIIAALLAMQNQPAPGVVGIVLAIVTISVGWGLWSLKHWAYWTAVILIILLTLASLYGLFSGSHSPIGVLVLLVFHLAIRVLILIYLFVDSKVRKAFRT